MKTSTRRVVLAIVVAVGAAATLAHAQQGTLTAEQRARRLDMEKELQSLAIVERKVMMPMRDGVRLATDLYFPGLDGRRAPGRFSPC